MNNFMNAMSNGGGSQPSFLVGMLPVLVIFLAFYFLILYPQLKTQKKHKNLLSTLKTGDKVVTNGGIYGIIVGVETHTVRFKIASNVVIVIDKSAISGIQPEETIEQEKS